MICDSKCCRRSGEKIWCKKNLGLKGLRDVNIVNTENTRNERVDINAFHLI